MVAVALCNEDESYTCGEGYTREQAQEHANEIVRRWNAHDEIVKAVEEYHRALDNRKHGGIAQSEAIQKIEAVLDMHWKG